MERYKKLPLAREHEPTSKSYAVTTGEFRPPLKGEWFASGATVEAYKAYSDLATSYWICKPVGLKVSQRTLDLAIKIGQLQPAIQSR
jgi:hypothetical protein